MEMICINCPKGCVMQVEKYTEGVKVTGNTCKKGEIYAQKECTNPTRIVTSSVFVENGVLPVVSVKTQKDVPKEKIFDILKSLKNVRVEAPIEVGEIIVMNVADTGINIVATKEIKQVDK